jgi:hypothetical protein
MNKSYVSSLHNHLLESCGYSQAQTGMDDFSDPMYLIFDIPQDHFFNR